MTKLTKKEFQIKWAIDADITLEEAISGWRFEACGCAEDGCRGWIASAETVEAQNSIDLDQNKYINKHFDGAEIWIDVKGNHYHTSFYCPMVDPQTYTKQILSLDNFPLNEKGKVYRPDLCAHTKFRKEFRCNLWFSRLSEEQKMWIHYYFHDIDDKDKVDVVGQINIEDMHEGIRV